MGAGATDVALAPCGKSGIRDYDRHLLRVHNNDSSFFLARSCSTVHITLLKSKIHRATVTQCELHYEGSCAIDEDLLDASGIREFEQLHVWNINNGSRLVTYAIKAERGSGVVSLNGSAARHASVGDLVILATYAQMSEAEAQAFAPKLVFVNEGNQQVELRGSIPTQAAPKL